MLRSYSSLPCHAKVRAPVSLACPGDRVLVDRLPASNDLLTIAEHVPHLTTAVRSLKLY
ncbi:hypothetical protein V1282_006179 [Nitrobacteraceae bacterium AZCC 2146]